MTGPIRSCIFLLMNCKSLRSGSFMLLPFPISNLDWGNLLGVRLICCRIAAGFPIRISTILITNLCLA